jgi:hypothetical protein
LLQENQWGNIYEILVEDHTTLTVEAGEFDCVNSQRYARNLEDEELPALDRFYYSNGFGLLYDTSSFISMNTPIIIRRLDSYQIQ